MLEKSVRAGRLLLRVASLGSWTRMSEACKGTCTGALVVGAWVVVAAVVATTKGAAPLGQQTNA